MSMLEIAGAPAIYYTVDGTRGPWLVLSHSLGCDVSMWELQMPALAERYRVLRYDTRGHGRSGAGAAPYSLDELAGDAAQLMDHLGIGFGDGLEMNVAAKIMLLAQDAGDFDQLLHRVIGAAHDA